MHPIQVTLDRITQEFKINSPNIAFNIPRLGLLTILEDLFNETYESGKDNGYNLGYKEGYNYQPTEVENGWE